jgi:MscS family membrane protein
MRRPDRRDVDTSREPRTRTGAASVDRDAPPHRKGEPMMQRVLRNALLTLIALSACATAAAAAESSVTAPPAAPATGVERGSPQATVAGFFDAAAADDYERASQYVDLAARPAAQRAEAARKLHAVLERQVWVDINALSDDAAGDTNDGLAPDQERLAWLDTPDGPRGVVLQRRDRDGGQSWLFSAATATAAQRVYDAQGYGRAAEMLPAALVEYQLFDVQLWQWIGLLVLVAVSYFAAWIIVRAVSALLAPLLRRTHAGLDEQLLRIAVGPARLLVGVAIFSAGRLPLDLTAAARTVLDMAEYLLVVAAVAWAVLRLMDVLGDALHDRLVRHGQGSAVNLVAPGRRAAKVFVVALAFVAMLDGFGFDVTAVLAGLGVGGIAVALAAQKSIENLFGGVALYADRPVRVGDFCRFGDTVGTVEDIGLRSTRIRTLERTVVTVPNAEFASLQIENYTRRDKFWYHPTIGLRYETTPDQLRYILVEVRRMLYAHPAVDPTPARVRFETFGAYSLDLKVFAYILAASYDASLEVAEDLNLRVMDIVANAGSSFAFPSQTTYVESGEGLDAERTRAAEDDVAAWRERGALYLPRFPEREISALRGTLDYPVPGSPDASATGDGRRSKARSEPGTSDGSSGW